MADADDDVSGVTELLAKTSLDQPIEVSGKGQDLNSAEDGQESKDHHLQVAGTAISPRRKKPKSRIPVTAADFLAIPTAEKLQALGNQRAEKILDELGNEAYKESAIYKRLQAVANKAGEKILRDLTNEEFETRALMKMFVKISSVMDNENNDVKNAVYQCTDALLKKLFSSEKFTPESITASFLLCYNMWQFKGSSSGMLLTLEHAVKQQYPESTALWIRNRMMTLLSSIDSHAPTQSYIKLCTGNFRSIRNKLTKVHNFVVKNEVDVTAITETFLKYYDPPIIVPDHGFVHRPRTDRPSGGRGGGTALLFKDTIDVHQVVASETRSFEYACYRISFRSFQLKLINIYRPPPSKSHPVPISDFFPEFRIFLQEHLLCNIPVIITGDFNIHVDIDNSVKKSFKTLLDSLNCTQHVHFPTQTHGHTLDLVISRKSDNIIVGRPWRGPLVSDHYSVMYLLKSVKAPVPSMKTSSRKIGCIDMDSLKNDVANSRLCLQTPDNLPELVALYFDILRSILNKHAPLIPNVTPHPQENSSDQRKPHPVLPPFVDKRKFVNDLGQFFCDKIVRIHSDINSAVDDGTCTPDIFSDPTGFQISHFKTLSVKDVEKLVTNLSKKSCSLDPMPTKLVLQCTESLLLVFTKIINLSLSNGHFPSDWKVALVKPLLKKYDMDFKFNNLRPVSNLPFISRLAEGAVTQQIEEHICNGALFPSMQSAYRQFHSQSTETALVRIKNDLLLSMDNKKVTLLVLLDLSAAFDTIDHGILLKILHSSFGLSDIVLSWIDSYLYKRQQNIILDNVISKQFHFPYGVPQGSRLGFLLFTLYISNLIKIIQSFPNVSCHFYADNTHLYIFFSPDKEHQYDNISILESCIRSLMFQYKLMLDDAKTEFLIVGTFSQLIKLKTDHLVAGDSEKLSSSVRNLVAWIHSHLNTCESASYRLLQSPLHS